MNYGATLLELALYKGKSDLVLGLLEWIGGETPAKSRRTTARSRGRPVTTEEVNLREQRAGAQARGDYEKVQKLDRELGDRFFPKNGENAKAHMELVSDVLMHGRSSGKYPTKHTKE